MDIASEAGSSLTKTLTGSPSLEAVLGSRPVIPKEVDRQLLGTLRQEIATSDVPEKLKHVARANFWSTLTEVTRRSPR